MNNFLRKLDQLLVWIFAIDWYLIRFHWTFISWDVVHWQAGYSFIWGKSNFFCIDFQNIFMLSSQIDPDEIDSDNSQIL